MTIGIMGLGYVGLPLAVAFAEEGHDVIALDTDGRKVDALRAGDSYIEDIPSERLAAVADRIEATTRPQPLARCDAVLIRAPTPLTAKAGVGDLRESPALKIVRVLRGLGGEIAYHDPHVPELVELGLHSVPVDDPLADADLALIVPAHPGVDHDAIVERAPLVLDLRGATRRRSGERTSVLL